MIHDLKTFAYCKWIGLVPRWSAGMWGVWKLGCLWLFITTLKEIVGWGFCGVEMSLLFWCSTLIRRWNVIHVPRCSYVADGCLLAEQQTGISSHFHWQKNAWNYSILIYQPPRPRFYCHSFIHSVLGKLNSVASQSHFETVMYCGCGRGVGCM